MESSDATGSASEVGDSIARDQQSTVTGAAAGARCET
jgi:hypothetical protein